MHVDPFESAVDAVIAGDLDGLASQLQARPDLVRDRSSRPHHSTLLHYLAANGVEDEHQVSPPNAAAVARQLLAAGADPNALADMYDDRYDTLCMLVSSTPPALAGVQVPLVHALVNGGASVEPHGHGLWTSPLVTALAFGFLDAAQALVQRGARVETLPAAAGLGLVDLTERLLPLASDDDRHRALAFAAQLGQLDIVRLLLDAGEDPNRFNPKGAHAHSTPLHQAAGAGHLAVVRLLVERGARLEVRDTIHSGTPLGWAEYGGRTEVARYLAAGSNDH